MNEFHIREICCYHYQNKRQLNLEITLMTNYIKLCTVCIDCYFTGAHKDTQIYFLLNSKHLLKFEPMILINKFDSI